MKPEIKLQVMKIRNLEVTLFWKIFLLIILTAVIVSWSSHRSDCKNSTYILEQSQKRYNADQNWQQSEITLHIQEPRVGTPNRFTKLRINNASDYFEMERNREEGMLKIILEENKEGQIFLNGKSGFPREIMEKYGNPERIERSKNFYKTMYGLPMSLNDEFWKKIESAQKAEFEGDEVYRIDIEPKEELISKHWTIIISVETYEILAIEFNRPEELNGNEEIIKFHGEYEVNGVKIPRVRNWYDKNTNEYLGTDVIVKGLKQKIPG